MLNLKRTAFGDSYLSFLKLPLCVLFPVKPQDHDLAKIGGNEEVKLISNNFKCKIANRFKHCYFNVPKLYSKFT